MKQEKIEMFLMSNQKYFEASQIPMIAEKLQNLDDEKFMFISSLNYKDPTIMLIVSLFFGSLGIDRFILGDVVVGIIKLLTLGGFGILTIIDWFIIMGKTRQRNLELFFERINFKNNPLFINKPTSQINNSSNNIEEIKKYKNLLDAGIITQEEYEIKKKELLK